MVIKIENLLLGAGVSSLAAGYFLKLAGKKNLLLEQAPTYGGLSGNFTINGFRFDRFVHLSFAQKPEEVTRVFGLSCPDQWTLESNPFNFYKRKWVKHPAQNNLFPLSEEEKILIVNDFQKRKEIDPIHIKNYEQWLRCQFGDYFAENFPIKYTRKYWMSEAYQLETKWTGGRFYQPSIEEVIKGCQTPDTPVTYYSKQMKYPKYGGFKSYLDEMVRHCDIRCNQKIVQIDTFKKQVLTEDGNLYEYENLISSLPLTEMKNLILKMPKEIKNAADKLRHTSGYLVSIGLKGENKVPPYLWWYIYDEDILPARAYSPGLKSPDNVPDGCSSMQLEIYCEESTYTYDQLYDGSVKKLIDSGIIIEDDILFVDIRFEKYANVIFDHNIYEAREIVKKYLIEQEIHLVGRFGQWEYFWTDQAFMSGKAAADKIIQG